MRMFFIRNRTFRKANFLLLKLRYRVVHRKYC